MCEQINCKYKPDQKWCGYHDPNRYHKNKKSDKIKIDNDIEIEDIKKYVDEKVDKIILVLKNLNINIIENNERLFKELTNKSQPMTPINMLTLGID